MELFGISKDRSGTLKLLIYEPGTPKIPAKNSEVTALGENILYKYSFCMVFGFRIGLSVLMLKNPGVPTPSSRLGGISPSGSVVRTEVGTSASGARLKNSRLRVCGDAKSVTWSVTYGMLSGFLSRRPSSISILEYWRGAARTTVSKSSSLVDTSPELDSLMAVLTLYLPSCFVTAVTDLLRWTVAFEAFNMPLKICQLPLICGSALVVARA